TGGNDTVQIGANALDLIFSRTGNNLQINIAGSDDELILQSWYSSTKYQTEQIEANDGYCISNQDIQLLIDTMASFTTSENISWENAVNTRGADVQQIVDQVWTID
ncbi:hypothetical protein LJC42_08220, partial [Eubacteriales bacterium OttesenSCG-928-K08]|nr:hypothetical protein [Eubacteriales bacterium OttesenSCG-928-K08]